jgi:hypothetical protein
MASPSVKKTYSKSQLQQGVCHNVALPFKLKKYLKAKEEF